jgi:hypothetical protein
MRNPFRRRIPQPSVPQISPLLVENPQEGIMIIADSLEEAQEKLRECGYDSALPLLATDDPSAEVTA